MGNKAETSEFASDFGTGKYKQCDVEFKKCQKANYNDYVHGVCMKEWDRCAEEAHNASQKPDPVPEPET